MILIKLPPLLPAPITLFANHASPLEAYGPFQQSPKLSKPSDSPPDSLHDLLLQQSLLLQVCEQRVESMQQEITHLRELLNGKDTNQTALFDPQSRKKKELVAQIEDRAMKLKENEARVQIKQHASIAGIAIKALFGLILSSKWVLTKCMIFQFEYEPFFRYLINAFGLTPYCLETCVGQEVLVSFTLDGAALTNHLSHLLAGMKIVDHRATGRKNRERGQGQCAGIFKEIVTECSDLITDVGLFRTCKCIMSHRGIKMMICSASGLPRVLHKIALSMIA